MTNITRATEAALPNRKFLAHISSRSQSARDLRAQEEYVKDNDRNQEGQSAGRDAARAQRIRATTQRPISPSRTPTHGLSPLGSTLGSRLVSVSAGVDSRLVSTSASSSSPASDVVGSPGVDTSRLRRTQALNQLIPGRSFSTEGTEFTKLRLVCTLVDIYFLGPQFV